MTARYATSKDDMTQKSAGRRWEIADLPFNRRYQRGPHFVTPEARKGYIVIETSFRIRYTGKVSSVVQTATVKTTHQYIYTLKLFNL